MSLTNQLLKYVNNYAVEVFKTIGGRYIPKKYNGRKPPLTNDTIEKIYKLARETWDWDLLEGCMVIIFSLSTGIRTEESRIFDIDGIHLNGKESYVYIDNVKGSTRYGMPRITPIMDGTEDIFEKYLNRRKHVVRWSGSNNEAMFPNLTQPRKKYLTQQQFCLLKKPVEDIIGERIEIRAARRAFGQRAIDNGHDLSDISVAMGHMSTRTTEKYYCRVGNEKAVENMLKRKNSIDTH